jgi:hypothetical protein
LYHRDFSLPRGRPEKLANDARGHCWRVAAAYKEVVQASRGPVRTASEPGQATASHGSSPFQDRLAGHRVQRHVDDVAGHTAGAELGPQAGGPVAAGRARLHPAAGEGRVVYVASGGELADQNGGQIGRGPAADESPGEVGLGPGATGQQIRGDPPGGGRVEEPARCGARGYFFLAKGLLPAEVPPADGPVPGAGFFSSPSNVISPVEKIPRTLRSKSSALVAASRAVS